jgi:hypothetical protein
LQLAPGLPALPISGLEDLLGKLAGATGDLLGALGDILKQLSQGQLGQLLQIPQLAPLKGIVCTLTQNSGPLAFLSNTLLLALGCSNAVPATIASNVTSVLNEVGSLLQQKRAADADTLAPSRRLPVSLPQSIRFVEAEPPLGACR